MICIGFTIHCQMYKIRGNYENLKRKKGKQVGKQVCKQVINKYVGK